jgi:hypothetical protein
MLKLALALSKLTHSGISSDSCFRKSETAELRSEIDRLKSALEKANSAAASKSKPRAEEGVMDVSASKASDDSKLGEDGPPAKKKSRKGKDE